MKYRSYRPGPPLEGLVETLWSLSDAPSHTHERILPSGTFELVINLHENEFRIHGNSASPTPARYRGAMVSGAYRRSFVIDTDEHASVMGVHFAPGGALPFFGVPLGHLADTHVELETLWPGEASQLRERLCEEASPDGRFRILETALRGRLSPRLEGHGQVRAALGQLARPGLSIAEIARHVGLSHRRLIQLFTAEVGTSPKLFSRLLRFQRALAVVQEARAVNWAALASACGYYDQSHLIKDFGEFAGASPTELRRHRRDPVKSNHLAM